MPAFLDEVLSPAFVAASKDKTKYAFGQIFKVPAYYAPQRLEIWRPRNVDQRLGTAEDFNLEVSPPDAFKRKIGLTNPPLTTEEEFLVLRAKRRPVLLIQPPDAELLTVSKGTFRSPIVRHLATIALFFSVENAAGDAKFRPEFLERVRRLEYKQFMFFKKGGPLTLDSLLRLDCVQSIPEAQLEPSEFAVSPDICDVLKAQLMFYQTGLLASEFADWAGILKL